MLGFIAALAAEFASHKGLLQQYRMAPGPIAAVFLLFTIASLIPISKVRDLTRPASACIVSLERCLQYLRMLDRAGGMLPLLRVPT